MGPGTGTAPGSELDKLNSLSLLPARPAPAARPRARPSPGTDSALIACGRGGGSELVSASLSALPPSRASLKRGPTSRRSVSGLFSGSGRPLRTERLETRNSALSTKRRASHQARSFSRCSFPLPETAGPSALRSDSLSSFLSAWTDSLKPLVTESRDSVSGVNPASRGFRVVKITDELIYLFMFFRRNFYN